MEVSRISEIRLAPVAAQVTTEQAATDASPSWPAGAVASQPEAANGWAAMLGALERAGAQVSVLNVEFAGRMWRLEADR